jgi:hypothetical protein
MIMEDKLDHLIRSLFHGNGILGARIKQKPADFLDNFVKREAVQTVTKSFVNEISLQFDEAVKQHQSVEPEETVKVSVNEELSVSASQVEDKPQSNLINPYGIHMREVAEIRNYEYNPIENKISPDTPEATPTDTQTALTETAPQSPPVSTPLPLSTTPADLRPGVVPPANTPPPKQPTPTLEQSRTTFSIGANGKAKVDFRGTVEGRSAGGKAVIIRDVIIPPDLGLLFDAATSELHGIPLKAGEFKLQVHFEFDRQLPGAPLLTGECNLIVNPDPKTLWKNLESDKNDTYWKEDQAATAIAGKDGLCMIVASKRGRSHAHVGSFRDDDFCLMQDEESGWRVMTVADGAGSAKLSRKGSLIASRTATDSVLNALTGEKGQKLVEAIGLRETDLSTAQKLIQDELYYLFGTAAKDAVHAIEIEAKSTGAVYKDYSTTLIVTIHRKIVAGHFVAAYWVGDGGVGVYRQGQDVKVLGKADSGEFAGQTRFLDSAMLHAQEIINRIKVTVVPDLTAIIAMTDGITDPRFETDANIENREKWDSLWTELSPLTESGAPASALLDWLDFWSPGNHDDRTIAMLYTARNVVEPAPEVAV